MLISLSDTKIAHFFEILAFTLLLMGCTSPPPPPEGMERIEFIGKRNILCVREGLITDQWFPADALFGSPKTSSITVRLPEQGPSLEDVVVFIGRSPDSINHAYFMGLSLFIDKYPESVRLDSQRDVYLLDLEFLPWAEDRQKLIDRFTPGDGSRFRMVSRNIRELLKKLTDRSHDPTDIFYGRCATDPQGRLHCRRQFPFHLFKGYYAQYPLPENWGKDWFDRDKEIRSFLAQVVIACE